MNFTHLNAVQFKSLKTIDKPSGGRFYNTPDGLLYPSVTTVLGSIEKPGLENWKKSIGATKAKQEMERCAARGTAIHLITEKYLNNDPTYADGISYDYLRGFNNLKIYLNQINNIIGQEVALYSDTLQLAGRVDCIAEYNGVVSIIDFKTSTNVKSVELVEDYFLQCTAYALMLEEHYDICVYQIVVMICVEKGTPLIFKRSFEQYIKPLLHRIKQYQLKFNK